MKKSVLWTKKSPVPMLLALVLSIVIVSVGTSSFTPTITATSSTATVYFDTPTINGTAIGVGNTVTVNLNIVDAVNIYSWQAGLIFNNTLLNCTGFFEGEFLSDVGPTWPIEGTINNTIGLVKPYGWTLLGEYWASGSGRLAYLTFTVMALGVSDLHLRNAKSFDWVETSPGVWEKVNVPINLIDVYTVFVDTIPHTVKIFSNSTGVDTIWVGTEKVTVNSGFYDHAFSIPDQELSFKVTGPFGGWSNVTIPKTLLNVTTLAEWGVIIDGSPLTAEKRTVTPNATHTSIYFTYTSGIHDVSVTTRAIASSTITINLSPTSIDLGSSVAISGYIDPMRTNVTVTIQYRKSGTAAWTTLGTATTNGNGNYSYTWTPTKAGTYELKASWAGDPNTEGDETDSPYPTLTVKGAAAGIDPLIIVAAVVPVIIIVAVVVVYYFVKIRKPEEEE